MEPPKIRKIALQIAALLPDDCEIAKSVLGAVEDLLLWRGQVSDTPDESSSFTRRSGSDETSPQ